MGIRTTFLVRSRVGDLLPTCESSLTLENEANHDSIIDKRAKCRRWSVPHEHLERTHEDHFAAPDCFVSGLTLCKWTFLIRIRRIGYSCLEIDREARVWAWDPTTSVLSTKHRSVFIVLFASTMVDVGGEWVILSCTRKFFFQIRKWLYEHRDVELTPFRQRSAVAAHCTMVRTNHVECVVVKHGFSFRERISVHTMHS